MHSHKETHHGILKSESGFILLLSVLILGALGAAVTVSLLQLGLSASRTANTIELSQAARDLANTCAEEAIERLTRDNTYAAGATITLGNGTCTINTISGSGDVNREVQVTGEVQNVDRKVEVYIDNLAAPVTISSWQEVADF
jgi:hypothetical protein